MSKYNMKNWTFKEWLLGNGKTVKEIIKVGVPLGLSLIITQNVALNGLITLLGKLLLDSAEYFIKE